MLFGAVGGAIVAEVSTPSLIETLHELDNQNELPSGKRLLSLMILEDADDSTWADKWKAVIDHKDTHAFDIDTLIDRLWNSVNRKALDEVQDRRVIKVVEAVEAKFGWEKGQKSAMLQEIRDLADVKRAEEN